MLFCWRFFLLYTTFFCQFIWTDFGLATKWICRRRGDRWRTTGCTVLLPTKEFRCKEDPEASQSVLKHKCPVNDVRVKLIFRGSKSPFISHLKFDEQEQVCLAGSCCILNSLLWKKGSSLGGRASSNIGTGYYFYQRPLWSRESSTSLPFFHLCRIFQNEKQSSPEYLLYCFCFCFLPGKECVWLEKFEPKFWSRMESEP